MQAIALKEEAVAVGQQVAEKYPEDALAHALLGSAFYNTGKAEQAARHLRKCLELNPGQADAYEILARVAYEKGELEETIRLCQEALKRGPANPEVLNRLARAFLDLGRTQDAVGTLERAVGLRDPDSESFYLLGQAHLQAGDFQKAKDSFLRAVALVPDHTQAFFGLFTASSRLGQAEEAERYRKEFQKLEAIDRQHLTDRSADKESLSGLPLVGKTVARTLFGAAQIYRLHKEAEKAGELYFKAARLDAESPVYRAALEAHYAQAKAPEESVAVFKKLASEQPENPLNYFFLARVYGRLERFEDAEVAYLKVLALAPQWAQGYRGLTELYLRANRKPAEAQKLARKLAELEPAGYHYYLLAVACMKNGDRTGALKALEQAVALSPEEKRYQDFLQQLKTAK